jgi:hypothetical protein
MKLLHHLVSGTLPVIMERTKGVQVLLDIIRIYPNDVWILENAANILHVTIKGASKPGMCRVTRCYLCACVVVVVVVLLNPYTHLSINVAALLSQIRALKGKAMLDNAHKRFPNSDIISSAHADFHRRGSACTIS